MGFEYFKMGGAGMTCMKHTSASDPIKEIKGPAIDKQCDSMCQECYEYLKQDQTPPLALANNL